MVLVCLERVKIKFLARITHRMEFDMLQGVGKKEWVLNVDPEPQFGLVARNCFDFNNKLILDTWFNISIQFVVLIPKQRFHFLNLFSCYKILPALW
jgi:hypothetical protein